MVGDLLSHELEVVKAFFARAISWTAAEAEAENVRLTRHGKPTEEDIEDAATHPHGAQSLEEIALRSVINELNALSEFALQNTWVSIAKEYFLPTGELVFTASRGAIEKSLADRDVRVKDWPHWQEVGKIKELSEAFKHRQRLQPFPVELHEKRNAWRSVRAVDPSNVEWVTDYTVSESQVSQYISAIEELLLWLQHRYAL